MFLGMEAGTHVDHAAAETRRVNAQVRSLTNRLDKLQKENASLRLSNARLQRGVRVKEAKVEARLRGAVTRINYLLEQRTQVRAARRRCTLGAPAPARASPTRRAAMAVSLSLPQLQQQFRDRDSYVTRLEAKLLQQGRELRKYVAGAGGRWGCPVPDCARRRPAAATLAS